MIQLYSNSLGNEELTKVDEVFKSKWLGRGMECELFEQEFCKHFGVSTDSILLLNNCTAAIFVGLKAIGVKRGDEVIISTINFVACASAVLSLGAVPVFADVDPKTLNILPSEIDRLKTIRTRCVIILHYAGHPAPIDEILQACGEKIMLFEDSANSVSSLYKGSYCGTLGDAGTWSFDSMKTIVMGDGGALFLKNEDYRKRATSLRYLGFAPHTVSGSQSMLQKDNRWWEYEVLEPSGRYINNDLMAGIGRIQLQKMPGFVQKRKTIWEAYQEAFKNIAQINCPPEPLPSCTSSYYMYWLQVGDYRDKLSIYLKDNGVYSSFRYFPLHLVKQFGNGCKLPNAEKVNEVTLNIPIHQELTDDQVNKIIDLVSDFFKQ